jgi:hypothetical protein
MEANAKVINFTEAAHALGKAPPPPIQQVPNQTDINLPDEAAGTQVNTTAAEGDTELSSTQMLEADQQFEQPEINVQQKKGKPRPAGYSSWSAMKQRCTNQNHKHYKDYGARGISYSPSWETFKSFIEDMGAPTDDGASLDRIDVDGNYCKENCEWASPKTQARNRRSNRLVEYRGETFPLATLAERFDIDPNTLRARLKRGMSVEQAVKQPVQWGGDRNNSMANPTSEYDRWPIQLTGDSMDKLEIAYAGRPYRDHSRPKFFLLYAKIDIEEAYATLSANPDDFSSSEIERAEKCVAAHCCAKVFLERHMTLTE